MHTDWKNEIDPPEHTRTGGVIHTRHSRIENIFHTEELRIDGDRGSAEPNNDEYGCEHDGGGVRRSRQRKNDGQQQAHQQWSPQIPYQ